MTRDRLGRIERIERSLVDPPPADVPLSRHELRELLELERDYDRRFPEIDAMDQGHLDEFLVYHCASGGAAERLEHLRARNRSPAERASIAATEIALESMTLDELDQFMAARTAAEQAEQ
jgi:hypothetical protein